MKQRRWQRIGSRGLAVLTAFFLIPLVQAVGLPAAQADSKVHLTIGGGGPGGGLKARTEAVAEAIRRTAGYQVTVLTSDMTTSCMRMATNEQDLAFLGSYMAKRAQEGKPPFAKPIPIRLFSHACFQLQQVVVMANTGLTSLKEAIEKKYPLKISVGKKNGATHNINKVIWEAHGAQLEDIEKWGGKVFYLASGETADMLADGTINAAAGQWELPATHLMDVSKNRSFTMLALDEKAVAILEKQGLLRSSVPAKKPYPWVEKEILTVLDANSITTVATSPKVTEEVAYQITKALYAQKEYLLNAHVSFSGLTAKDTLFASEVVPFHPGAERYFRETGGLKK